MPRSPPAVLSRLHPRTEARRIDAYHETTSDGEAARRLGMRPIAFAEWRRRRDVPAKHPRPGNPILGVREQSRRLAAYRAEATDGDVARALGISRNAFRTWREIQSLPAKRDRPARIDRREETRRLEAYHAADSDEAAARALGVGVGGFNWWRQQQGLPGKGMGGLTVAETEDARRRRVYEETENDIEAARRLGITQSGFQRWRVKTGLPAKSPNKGQRIAPTEQARRMRAYRKGFTDQETAHRLGLKLATYRGWRQAQGLPAWRRPLAASR